MSRESLLSGVLRIVAGRLAGVMVSNDLRELVALHDPFLGTADR
ncbi:hypothetical protein [Streptomyces nigra]|nr:hypothetical protein [Streptomyces nigra]